MKSRVSVAGPLALLLMASSCASRDRESRSEEAPDLNTPVRSANLVQWLFQSGPTERIRGDSLLAQVHDRYYPAGEPVVGELHRFSRDTATARYLLIASVPAASGTGGAQSVVRFFVLDASAGAVSTPSPMPITDDPSGFADMAIDDFDADSVLDVAYCVWTGPPGSTGRASIVGYRGGEWYGVRPTRRSPPDCGPRPAP